MSQLMTLPTTTTQEDFMEQFFAELFQSFLQPARTDLSCPLEPSTRADSRPQSSVVAQTTSSRNRTERSTSRLQSRVPATSISPTATDADLVEQAAAGDERAF